MPASAGIFHFGIGHDCSCLLISVRVIRILAS
jgi:hypothetical protein